MTNEELKKIREEKNQGKGEFAKSLGVIPMVYGRYESGTLKIPENKPEENKAYWVKGDESGAVELW